MDSPIPTTLTLRFPMGLPISPSAKDVPDELRPFACPQPGCHQRFKRKFTLKEHYKIHTGEKPFVCPVKSCAKTFTTSGNLARHKRLHPWLKPQACIVDGCDRFFSNELKLERHMKTHFKGPPTVYYCSVASCGKQFTTSGNLSRHLRHQHPDQRASVSSARSPRGVDDLHLCSSPVTPSQSCCGEPPTSDASKAFNPLVENEVSDVSDSELLEALQCLFDGIDS